jgi:DNA-binding NtrC family response regulator
MHKPTILFVSDDHGSSHCLFCAFQDAGYEVAITSSPLQAIALLFVMHAVAAVVIDQRASEHASLKLPCHLRAVRPNVPIILLSREQIGRLPAGVDACVTGEEPISGLLTVLHGMTDGSEAAA